MTCAATAFSYYGVPSLLNIGISEVNVRPILCKIKVGHYKNAKQIHILSSFPQSLQINSS